MTYGVVFGIAAVTTLAVGGMLLRLPGPMAQPVQDRWHKKSTPVTGGVALLGGVLLALAAGEALHHQPFSVAYVALGQLSHLAGSDGCSSSPRSRAGLYRVTFQAPYGTLACAG